MSRPDRERQLLGVSEQVLLELGYAATTMDEIARRAGVTKPLLYDHFGSKDGLVLAHVVRVRGELNEAIQRTIARGTTSEEMFRLGVRAFFDYIARHERVWSVLVAEGAITGLAAAEVEAMRHDTAQFVLRLFSRGSGARDTARLATYAQSVVGACERVALWHRGKGGPSSRDAARHLADVFWRGLGELS